MLTKHNIEETLLSIDNNLVRLRENAKPYAKIKRISLEPIIVAEDNCYNICGECKLILEDILW